MSKRSVDVVVISDVHLGTYGCRAKELVAYLKSIEPGLLILNGDIIDGWQFSKRYFPPNHMAVIKEILSMMMNGTRTFYITGNHDEQLRKYSDLQIGNFTLTDKLVLEINDKMTWIFHGDAFDNTTKGSARFLAKLGSNGYASLLLINRFINFLLQSAGRERISFAKKVMAGVNKAVSKIADFEQIAAEIAIAKKYDYVICGHIHQPQNRVVETADGKVTYLNSGDWIDHLTALEYSNREWKIFTYEEKDFQHTVIDMKTRPSVITDEISFYINSLASNY
ncbi:MAG: UDP-2,3-diacylglucosamine diphosphatase [Chitinophagaceae bacterium]|nr:UDP-2,3-diacylglucosamine diphosphatase [Chitinophagaceae bacterium]